jgi:predicted acylesterase/phospholipase RssA
LEANEELQISIDLIKYFYQELIVQCKSVEELNEKGITWLEEIKSKYNSKIILNNVYDIFLVELKNKTRKGIEYNALIMKGGGIKGLAYVGALEELLNYYTFNWYAGTSAGAITAILLGSGYTVQELNEILSKKNFNDFKDANNIKAILNLCTKSGLYEANSFNEWIEDLLATKLESAVSVEMRDLPFRTTVFASRKDKSIQVFDSLKPDSQKSIAAFAARCSMSIPLFFTPQKIDGKNVLDGGVKNNFPVDLILRDNEGMSFVGLYLGNKIYRHTKNSILKDLLQIWTESNDPEILKKYKNQIIIIDPAPISTLKFKLTDVEKEFLLESGRLSAIDFLDKNEYLNKNDYDYTNRINNNEAIRNSLILKKVKTKAIYLDLTFLIIFIAYITNLKLIITLLIDFISWTGVTHLF